MHVVALDTETHLIAPGQLVPPLVCLTLSTPDAEPELLTRIEALDVWRGLIRDKDATLVAHNAAFDLAVLANAAPDTLPDVFDAYRDGRIYCTKIHEQLADIARGWNRSHPDCRGRQPSYSLAALCERLLGVEVAGKEGDDVWRLRYAELDDVPLAEWPKAAREYALLDAVYARRVFEHQVARGDLSPDAGAQHRAAWALHLISAWGMQTDKVAIDALEARMTAEVRAVEQELIEAKVLRPNGSKNTAQIRLRVEHAYGDSAPTTASGATSTSREALEESGDPVLAKLAGIGKAQKILSTYVGSLRADGAYLVHPQYRTLVSSGRTSAYSPNVQNLPRGGGVRECYVPREGCWYVACDYHVAELCGLAQVLLDLYGESAMADALRAGRDLHLATAASILQISYADVVERYAQRDPAVKDARQLAKALNFGLPGGLSAKGFAGFAKAAYDLELSEDRARRLRETWLRAYPETQRYFADWSTKTRNGLVTVEQLRSRRLRGGCGYTDGANTLFQGIVADGAKAALWLLARACYVTAGSALFGCRPVAFIHDEVLVEVPAELEHARAAAAEIESLMIAGMRAFIPDVPIKADAHLMDRWYKDAEPVRDSAGELILWRPEIDA